jgi:hypothetical protein
VYKKEMCVTINIQSSTDFSWWHWWDPATKERDLPFRVEEDSGIDGEAYIFSNMPVTGSQLNTIQPYDGSTDVELYFLHLERAQAQFE